MKMTEFLDQSADWGDPSLINEMFHEDYMYLRETEMLTRDEFIKHMQEDCVDTIRLRRNLFQRVLARKMF